jgi:hypothetical protein
MTERKVTKRSAKAPLNLETARAKALGKITKAGAKGATSPATAKTGEPDRSLYAQALSELEAERVIFADRSKTAAKYFLIEFAPNSAGVADKMDRAAAIKHPTLLTAKDLEKGLSKLELACSREALATLESNRRLVRLLKGASVVFAHGDSLRAVLGVAPTAAATTTSVPSEAIRDSYANLVRLYGFPGVEIAALQSQSGVSMAALKEWLLEEHRAGRVVFGLGDWSLADETTRAGVIELRGDRYLLAEFKG